tara:strand:+ start:332 stop:538 length:207 start_codon:yes stop_codon:yes gene_type:complete
MNKNIRLNEYLYKKLMEEPPLSEEEIEKLIHDWYREKYFQQPPIWLVKRKRKSRWKNEKKVRNTKETG